MRYHVTLVRMSIIRMAGGTYSRVCRENPCTRLVGIHMGTTTVENNTKIPQEIKMERPYHALVTLGRQPQERKDNKELCVLLLCSYTHYLQ